MTDIAKAVINKREFKNIRGESFTQWTITVPGASARVDNRIVGAVLDEYAALRQLEAEERSVHGEQGVVDCSTCGIFATLEAIRAPERKQGA